MDNRKLKNPKPTKIDFQTELERAVEKRNSKIPRSEIAKDITFELYSGDAMFRGLTDLGFDTLMNLEGTTEQYREWGKTSFQRRLYKIAHNYFTKYFQASNLEAETDKELLNSAGLCHIYQNNLEEGLTFFNRILKFSPQNPDAHNNIGIVYYKQGDNESAKKHLEASIDYEPGYAVVYWNLALTEMKLNNPSQAFKRLKQAIDLDERYRERAKDHELFAPIRGDSKFKALLSS